MNDYIFFYKRNYVHIIVVFCIYIAVLRSSKQYRYSSWNSRGHECPTSSGIRPCPTTPCVWTCFSNIWFGGRQNAHPWEFSIMAARHDLHSLVNMLHDARPRYGLAIHLRSWNKTVLTFHMGNPLVPEVIHSVINRKCHCIFLSMFSAHVRLEQRILMQCTLPKLSLEFQGVRLRVRFLIPWLLYYS
jgi:hypothetical protein